MHELARGRQCCADLHTPAVQVLDLGCGVGGPAREICRFSRANIVGVNNNAFQITRAKKLTAEAGPFVAARCSFVQSDFMKLPFADASHDHAYAIEATCHAPEPAACYAEIARCIKPGGMFVCYEWVRPPLPEGCFLGQYGPHAAGG